MDKIDEIYNELNNPNSDLEPFENAAHVPVGQILAAAYPSNKGQKVDYYRAKVIFIERKKSLAAPFEVPQTTVKKIIQIWSNLIKY